MFASLVNLYDQIPGYLLALVHFGPASWAVYHALLYKRDSRGALGWIMACIFVPFAGPVAYYFFGINRVRSRAIGLRHPIYLVDYESRAKDTSGVDRGGAGLAAPGFRVTGRGLRPDNEVLPLHNGDEAYPAMLDAIDSASREVLLATYILMHDAVGLQFAESLIRAAGRGVAVKVLIDGVGELYSRKKISATLREHDVPVARFLRPTLIPPSIYINLRNHRKILVVDSRIAFAGGMNIASDNCEHPASPSVTSPSRSITDIHFKFQGPVVDDLGQLFYHDWRFSTGSEERYRATEQHHRAGGDQCRVVPDGPDSGLDSLALLLQAAISASTHSVDVMTPYFLPNRDLLAALLAAALRGVRVRIVVPAENNLQLVHWANRNMLYELLQWRVEVYYQPAPFCHSKLLCIDHDYCLIGSANLDERSLRLNFEVGIETFSRTLNRDLRAHFDAVIARSVRLRSEVLAKRRVFERVRDSAAALFSPYL